MNYSTLPPLSNEPTPAATAIGDRDFRGRLLVGDHILDLGALRLVSDPEVRVTRKAAAVMIYLARHQGRTISRNELLDHVWVGTCPTPEVVTQAVMELRRVLGDDGRANSVIETVPRLGYRLAVPAVFQESLPTLAIRRASAAAASGPESTPVPAFAADVLASSPPARVEVPSASMRRALWLLLLIGLLVLIPKLVTLIGERGLSANTPVSIGPPRMVGGSSGAEFFPDLTPDAANVVFSAPDRASVDVFKLFEKSLGGSTASRITTDAVGEELLPSIAPDGKQLAYVRMHEGRCEVRIMRIPGGANQLAFPCAVSMLPYLEWSADSARLLTHAREPGKPSSVRLIEYHLADGELRWLDYAHADSDVDVEPRYAPDGHSIAFRRGARPGSSLWLLNRDSGMLTPILSEPQNILGFDWLDNPPRLIAALHEDGETRLAVIELDGHIARSEVTSAQFPRVQNNQVIFMRGEQRVGVATLSLRQADAQRTFLALSIGPNNQPAYAPDGSAIAFISERASDRRLCVLQRGSATPMPMELTFRGTISSLSWSADSNRLLFVASKGKQSQLYLADTHSGATQKLEVNNVGTAAFDMAADAIWFTAEHEGQSRLHRLLAPASAAPLIVATPVLAEAVQTRAGVAGVFVQDRCIVQLDAALRPKYTYCPPQEHTAWRAGNDAIWTFRETGMRNVRLYRFDLATSTLADRGEYPLWWAGGAFDIAPDESELLYSAFNADEADIAIAPLLRGRSRISMKYPD